VRRRNNADRLPERFDEVLAAVMEFADPILSGTGDASTATKALMVSVCLSIVARPTLR